MRKIYFALVAFLMTVSVQVMAEDIDHDYDRIELGWALGGYDTGKHFYSTTNLITGDKHSTDDWGGLYFGFRAGYLHGFKLAQGKNFFVETGAQFNFMTSGVSSESGSYNEDTYLYTLAVPVNFAYKFQFTNCFIQPYIGGNVRFNLAATENYNDKTYDMFNEDEAYFGTFNRWQFGGQVGFRVGFRHVTLHCEYQKLTRLADLNKNLDSDIIKEGTKYSVKHGGTICLGIAYAF